MTGVRRETTRDTQHVEATSAILGWLGSLAHWTAACPLTSALLLLCHKTLHIYSMDDVNGLLAVVGVRVRRSGTANLRQITLLMWSHRMLHVFEHTAFAAARLRVAVRVFFFGSHV